MWFILHWWKKPALSAMDKTKPLVLNPPEECVVPLPGIKERAATSMGRVHRLITEETREDAQAETWEDAREESQGDAHGGTLDQSRETGSAKRKPPWTDPNPLCLPAPHQWVSAKGSKGGAASRAHLRQASGEERCFLYVPVRQFVTLVSQHPNQ